MSLDHIKEKANNSREKGKERRENMPIVLKRVRKEEGKKEREEKEITWETRTL